MHDTDHILWSLGPITCWHRDPCTDGSDSSCRHARENPSKTHWNQVKYAVTKDPVLAVERLFDLRSKDPDPARALFRAVIFVTIVHDAMGRPMKDKFALHHMRIASIVWPSICYLPGYHSNDDSDAPDAYSFRDHRSRVAHWVCRLIKLETRRWWDFHSSIHHLHHWRFTIRPFWKRWLEKDGADQEAKTTN